MSHIQQMNFVQRVKGTFPQNFTDVSVLEVGSLFINGTVKEFFTNCNYVGIDLDSGPNVDLVVGGHEYDAPENSFNTIISCECFEHNPFWVQTFANMIRMCKSNGLIIVTCATTGRAEHGTTRTTPRDSPFTVAKGWEYYNNLTEEDFNKNFNIPALFREYAFSINNTSFDLYFWGIKV